MSRFQKLTLIFLGIADLAQLIHTIWLFLHGESWLLAAMICLVLTGLIHNLLKQFTSGD
ncbi:hypothetical protein [Streptococcus saliviloxodontae]|uniref:Uncharacterized protein n=1 Tax=Streptococcus saliviloxodontae TaxID=1349416 RepID=A0ABS2PMC1_9STRE|nr:hypothetical protein [Streptococcus saliviloxodontae]MBM7636585.1 hypothetical protein [Streptococcus saliviloxodontae]